MCLTKAEVYQPQTGRHWYISCVYTHLQAQSQAKLSCRWRICDKWGYKLACVRDKLYKNTAEPHSLCLDRFCSPVFCQHVAANRRNGPMVWALCCWVVYSNSIIHQATGLGLAWAPRECRRLMAWHVVCRLSGLQCNAAGCWMETPRRISIHGGSSRHSWDCGFRHHKLGKRSLRSSMTPWWTVNSWWVQARNIIPGDTEVNTTPGCDWGFICEYSYLTCLLLLHCTSNSQ